MDDEDHNIAEAISLLDRAFVRVADESSGNVSIDFIEILLKHHNVKLEHPAIQAQFQKWHDEGFITLKGDKDIYLKVLRGGLNYNK